MKKMEYESPEFGFQGMKLLEKIANTCWGYKYGWYNGNKINFEQWGSCNDVSLGLEEFFIKNSIPYGKGDIAENSHSTLIDPPVS